MNRYHLFFSLFFGLFSLQAAAQVIDNTSTFKSINSDHYRRFQYDNDFFGNSDYYYTQGIAAEWVHPKLKKFPAAKLLVQPRSFHKKWGVGIDLFGYTPLSIRSDTIRHNDRPYAAVVSLKTFVLAVDSVHQQKWTSTITAGIIGPIALGNEIQSSIHRAIGRTIPQGWKYQVKNDLVLNYNLTYEKRLWRWKNNFLLSGKGEARAGTLNTRLTTGATVMAGKFNDPYNTLKFKRSKQNKFTYYVFGQSLVTFVGYDASLQGGVFNKKSVYTIPSNQINRITFQQTAGFAFSIKNVSVSYFKSRQTKEFKTGKRHMWGGISVGFAL